MFYTGYQEGRSMQTRPEVVGFRVSTEERKAIRAVAERLSRTEGDFLRLVALRIAEELGVKPAAQNDQRQAA